MQQNFLFSPCRVSILRSPHPYGCTNSSKCRYLSLRDVHVFSYFAADFSIAHFKPPVRIKNSDTFKRFILAVSGPSYCFKKDPFIFFHFAPWVWWHGAPWWHRENGVKEPWTYVGWALEPRWFEAKHNKVQNMTKKMRQGPVFKIWSFMHTEGYSFHPCCWMIFRTGATKHPDLCSTRIFHHFSFRQFLSAHVGFTWRNKTKSGIGVGLGGSGWVADERWPSKDQCCSSNRDSAFVRIVPFAGPLVVLYGCHCVLTQSRNKAILNGRRHTCVTIYLWSVPRNIYVNKCWRTKT